MYNYFLIMHKIMSKINIFSLGGLQENGKNLYVVEVDDKLFILDAGLKYPTSELYGVDNIIPDTTYLVENKDRIVGIFLTHGHDDHIGSVGHLLEEIETKVYGSRFTLALVRDGLKPNLNNDENFVEVKDSTEITFGDVKIRFYEVAHNIPDSLGIIINTPDGNIIYTGNFTFDQNAHQTDFTSMYESLVKASREGVLALLPETLGALNEGGRGTILEFKQRIENMFVSADGRIIVSLFSNDLQRIQMIVDISISFGRRVAILGRKTQKIVNLAINMGYLNIPEDKMANLKFIDDTRKNNDKDLVVIVTGERHEPYFMLQRMSKHIDRLVHIEATDTVIVLTNPYPGTEKMAARTLDMLYRVTTNVRNLKSNLLIESHADREELKQMINLLHPKYVIPVIGEYRHQYAMIQIARCVGFNLDNLKILDNGDVLSILNGEYVGITDSVPVGEIMIDGDAVGDVGDVVMRDRELLGEDGVLLVCCNINPRTKKLLTPVEIVSKGFTYLKENESFKDEIIKLFNKVADKYLHERFVNWSDFKNDLKNDLSRLVYKTSKANPIIIPVLISTDPDYKKPEKAKEEVLSDDTSL